MTSLPGKGAAPLSEDERINGPVSRPTPCAACGQQIVRMPAGHYRLASRDLTKDRLHCKRSRSGYHLPTPAGRRAIMSRVSPPWSDSTGERT